MGSTATPPDCSLLESDDFRQMIGRETLNVLKCSICWEFYRDPIILACGHTFCYRCLLEMGKHAKVNNNDRTPLHNVHFGCPNCRRPIYINSLLARRVTHNYALTSLIESLRQRTTVKKVSRETSTDSVEPTESWSQKFTPKKDPKRKRPKQDYNDRKFDLLTGNLDFMLRTLSANGTVLGDLSCAADIQQIVREYQDHIECSGDTDYDYDVPNGDTCTSDDNKVDPAESTGNSNTTDHNNEENGAVRNETESKNSKAPSYFSSLFPQTKAPQSAFQDPAIVSFSIDPPPPADQFPSFGLFSFPGFGRM